MRPSSFKIISWAKLEVSALYFNQLKMFASYKSVSGTNNARPKDSKEKGNFQNNDFYPKMKFFLQYRKNSLYNENNTLSHTKSCKLNRPSS